MFGYLPGTPQESEEPSVETTQTNREVEEWRLYELEQAGYEASAAIAIAHELDVDLHRACEMVEQGCPQDLALKILM